MVVMPSWCVGVGVGGGLVGDARQFQVGAPPAWVRVAWEDDAASSWAGWRWQLAETPIRDEAQG